MERTIPLVSIMALACMFPAAGAHGNNIRVANPSLTDDAAAAGQALVGFNITWENSWRTSTPPGNWDAAWVFVKYRTPDGLWHHAKLDNTGHTAPAGSAIGAGLLDPHGPFDAVNNPAVGAFIHRSADGTGTFTANGVELRWNYGADGIGYQDITEVRILGLEMVLVPQGEFSVGSGGTESGSFTDGAWTSGATIPFRIASEAELIIAQTAGALWGTSNAGDNTIGGAGTLPAAFPKGFAAFYSMKHEISQQGYVDFLNTLTREQQNARVVTNLATGVSSVANRYVMSSSQSQLSRNGIRCDASIDGNEPVAFYCDLNGNGIGSEADDGLWIACNKLNWGDVAAYLDWSGLRPMTELEFEKLCRGPLAPTPNEYPWGNSLIRGSTTLYTLNTGTAGTAMETVSNPEMGSEGNVMYGSVPFSLAPGRVGMFAMSGTSRSWSGAGYYGALDLGGNVRERLVNAAHAIGRAYTGTHGDGALDASGTHDAPGWPISMTGTGYRGAAPGYNNAHVHVSGRMHAVRNLDPRDTDGGRGVRSLP